jgi:tRNA threonylcarbamoyladenosine biosynthesis protein TsaB
MKILAADTSTPSGSVAILADGSVMVEWTLQSAQTHNRRLLKTVDSLLETLGWSLDDIDGFAVTSGPGSFTGLRIGLTTMKTLAWTLGKPYASIPSLDALAAPLAFARPPVCAILDAHKKEIYCALYRSDGHGGLTRKSPYMAMPPERMVDHIQEATVFCGDGWLLYRDLFRKALGPKVLEAPAPFHIIKAGFVAELARQRFLAGEADDPVLSVPLYIRPSEAELNYPASARPINGAS